MKLLRQACELQSCATGRGYLHVLLGRLHKTHESAGQSRECEQPRRALHDASDVAELQCFDETKLEFARRQSRGLWH